MRKHREVDTYLAAAPETQQPLLVKIRALIRKLLPDAVEDFQSRMPVYTVNGQWTAGFATRKKCPMLYVMNAAVLDAHAGTLGKLRSGNTCVEMRLAEKESLALAKQLLTALAQAHSAANT
jgi:hypothetical protein